MKYPYRYITFILLILLTNIGLSAQLPQDTFPFEEAQNPFSPTLEPHNLSAKTLTEENFVIARKLEYWSDSLWIGQDSTLFYYNDDNEIETEISYIFLNNWREFFKYTYEYNSNGDQSFKKTEEWIDSIWINLSRQFKEYDSNNNLVSSQTQKVYNDTIWYHSSISTYEYDENSNLLLYQYEDIDLTDVLKTYEYDTFGNRVLFLEQKSSGSNWIDSKKETYEYDTSNNLIVKITQLAVAGELINYEKMFYEYDSTNRVVEITQKWENDVWVNKYRRDYEYDESNNEIHRFYSNWENDNWIVTHDLRKFYDTDDNLIEALMYFDNDGKWRKGWAEIFEYKEGYLISDIIALLIDDKWTNWFRKTFYYLNEFVESEQEDEEELPSISTQSLYPNPSNGQFYIGLAEDEIEEGKLEIYNVKGQLVLSELIEEASGNLSINLEGLSNGTYYLELSDKDTQIKQTLMLVR